MASSNEIDAIHATGSRETQVPDDDVARQLLTTCLSRSWSNPRKRPSACDASDRFDTGQHDPILSKVANGAEQPHKRSRAADWPLKSTNTSSARSVTPRRAQKAPLSPGQKHNLSIKPRPSKFLEGSMNDRVSAKPPSIYTRDDAAMDEYHNHTSTNGLVSNDSNDVEGDKTYYDAGIETTKPSGMYRFGRALVSAFNPVNVWQGINGIWKDKEQPHHPEKNVLQERKIKAEKAYAVMKQNGFKGFQAFSARPASIDQSHTTDRSSLSDSLNASLCAPDAVANQTRQSTAFKHGSPTPTGSEDFLIPPLLTEARPPGILTAQGEDGHRTSLNLRRPSFQSLKKVKSHIQLSSTKRRVAESSFLSPGSDAVFKQKSGQALRRQPSKKDVAKRQKLSKQVSDLEGKLQAARRELQLCSSEVPSVPRIPSSARKTFVPRALPSLPSESNYKSTESSTRDESDPDWQPASSRKIRNQSSTPKKPAIKGSTVKTPKTTAKLPRNEPRNSGQKRKLSGGRRSDKSYKPEGSMENDSDSDLSISAKKLPRACKSQKLERSPAAHGDEATSKRSPTSASRGSRQVTSKYQTSVPPVPKRAAPFDPAKVDKHKLLAMRSIPKDDLPFGSHLDDIVNLQKEFPHCSQKQLDEYLSSLSKDHKGNKKPKDFENQQPNASHPERPSSAASGKPPASQDVSAQARQACKNSSPNKKVGRELSTIDEAITIDPSKDTSIPPMPNAFIKPTQSAEAASVSKEMPTDKPLPKIQKEDYAWPEDVF